MKQAFVFIFIWGVALPCTAQWKSIDLGVPVLAMAQHDTFFFMSGASPSAGPHIYRYTVAMGYAYAETGIDFTQGNVTSFASLGSYLFAGLTHSGGSNGPVYPSTDNGAHWTSAVVGGPIATNGSYLFGTYVNPTEVVRSRDLGKTWDSVAGFPIRTFAGMGINIFANTGSVIWRSQDTGNNWSQIHPPYTGTITVMDSLLYIVGNGSVTKSTDSGTDWSVVTVDSGGSVPETVNVLVTDGHNLFAGTTAGVYLSVDTGKTWLVENTGLGNYLNVDAMGVFDTLLFVNASGAGYYTAMRSIREMTDTTPSSVVQLPTSDTILVFPNPSLGTVTILSGSTSILGVQVLNVLGENILHFPNTRESDVTLDLSKLPSGTYFLEIQTATGIVLRKVIRE